MKSRGTKLKAWLASEKPGMNVLIDARPEWADKDTLKANRETAASMTTGVLCATPEEFDALHHRFEFNPEPTTVAGFQFWKGQAPDHPRSLILAQSGMGKVNAATLATILFTIFGCEDLVFSGVAGSLVELEVGSVVLVTRAATHDYGLVSNGAFTCVPVGDLPLPGIARPLQVLPRVPSHVERTLTHLRDRMVDKLTIRLGAVLSGDVFINCAEARARLLALGGDIVDMESAAVLEVARRFGKGAYVIRTISDGAGDDSHLSYTEMVAIVAHNSAVCVEDLLKIMP